MPWPLAPDNVAAMKRLQRMATKGFLTLFACGLHGPLSASAPLRINSANLCSAVEAQTLELQPGHPSVMYQYQSLVFNAAGVKASDDEATAHAKARSTLNREMPRLLCDQFNFRPRLGNVLKLAVSTHSDPFIDDALRSWGINLNQVDQADGLTVLDYIELKIREAGSNKVLVRLYQRYADRFRKAGAKRASELSPAAKP